MEGEWLVQTTTYYLNTCEVKSRNQKFTCQQVSRSSQQAKLLMDTVNKSNISSETCFLEYIFSTTKERSYFCFFYNQSQKTGHIMKHVNNNRAIKQYSFFVDCKNNICVESKHKNVETLEYLYSVNDNFGITKSMINKNNQCIAISFSSKIKMN